MSNENPRMTAVKLLCRIKENGSYSNILLDEHFKRSSMEPQEKKFCAALFYGTLERRLTLDMVIGKYSSRPSDKLSGEVRAILQTALYQLLYMDSVPESAAVNEAVKLASNSRNPAVKGYVNGLLRSFIRDGKKLPEMNDSNENLSLKYSCPLALVKKWSDELGQAAAEAMLEASLGTPPVTVKVNTLKTTASELIALLGSEGITAVPNRFFSDCLDWKGSSPEGSKAFRDGLFHVQDISSRLCCKALDPKPGMTVLDLCAAPGGKSFTAAELMQNQGHLYSFDLHKNRAKLISDGAVRLGLDIIDAGVNNAKLFNEQLTIADRVLCDVPCSGLGVIRRKPEIKYKDLANYDPLPDVQYDILNTSSRYVKQGGFMVYSTCTVSRAENEDVVSRFFESHKDFEPAPLWSDIGCFDGESSLTVLPQYFDSDGFFIAKFKKL